MWKAVILIGGPDKGTRFRPLSLDIPKPLFPIAGLPMVKHHIEACAKVPEVKEILLLGFYPADELKCFVDECKKETNLSIRYLMEFTALGTAGGIYHFRDQIKKGNPDGFFIVNSDVCCDFPLENIIDFHTMKTSEGITIVATNATSQQSLQYGCVVEKESTNEVTHYVEKPETYVSSLINCGVYAMSRKVLKFMEEQVEQHGFDVEFACSDAIEKLSLEKEVLKPYAGSGKMFVYKINDEWTQIKSAASAIHANRLILSNYVEKYPERLQKSGGKNQPEIRGNVFIHPSARVHPTAVLGPNVSIGENVLVEMGVRVCNSIILPNTVLEDHCCILNSIIGWESTVGCWSRVDGTSHQPNPNVKHSKMQSDNLFNHEGRLVPSITVLGRQVKVAPEIAILNSIVLPNKKLTSSSKNQIIL